MEREAAADGYALYHGFQYNCAGRRRSAVQCLAVKCLLAFRAGFQQLFPAKPMQLTQAHQRGFVRRSLAGLLCFLSVLLVGNLSLRGAPANDDFTAAQLVATASATLIGTNITATREVGEPAHAGSTNTATVWFRWTAPVTHAVALDTVGSDFDTALAVYTGTSLDNLSLVAANDDIEIGRVFQSCVRFPAQAGTTYLIALAGFEGAAGGYTLNLNAGNDHFAGAQVLTGASGTVAGQNIAASKEPGEPAHAGNRGGRSVWFRWTAPASGSFSFDTSGPPQGDTVLAVYTGTALTNLQLVVADDDGYLGSSSYYSFYGPSRVVFNSVAGETYSLALDGKDGTSFGYVLNWRPEPALPVITLFYASTNLVEGNDFYFHPQASVSGFGVGAQWFRDGQPATNLPNEGVISANGSSGFGGSSSGGSRGFGSGITTNDQGTYRLLATNYAGSVLSDPVVVTVTQVTAPRSLSIETNLAVPGSQIEVPIHWQSRGDERTVSFSISFDPTLLAFRKFEFPEFPGQISPALLTVLTTNQIAQGRLGVQMTNVPVQGIPYLYFDVVAASATTNSAIGFTDQPVLRETRSSNNSVLPTTYQDGMVEIHVGWEGDNFPAPNGDGLLMQQDFLATCRLLAGLNGTNQSLPLPYYRAQDVTGSYPFGQNGAFQPSFTKSVEFMQLDSWPRTNGGDAKFTLSDAVQAGRYAAGLDPLARAGGPMQPDFFYTRRRESPSATNAAPRQLRIQTRPARLLSNHEVSVRMTTMGDENAVAFSVAGETGDWWGNGFMYNKSARAGTDLGNATMFVNGSGFLLVKPPGETFPAGDLELVRLLLTVPASSGSTAGMLWFTDYPVSREVVNVQADVLPAVFNDAPLPYFHSLLNQRVESSNFRFQVTSEVGRRYILEASENMRTWFPIATNIATGESLDLQEAIPQGTGRRFYRLVLP